VVGYVIDALLPGYEEMLAKPTLSGEFSLRTDNTRLLVVIAVHAWVDISKMLRKMVFPETGLHIVNAIAGAEAADPRFTGIPKILSANDLGKIWPEAVRNPIASAKVAEKICEILREQLKQRNACYSPLFLVSLPVALPPITLSTLPGALVDFVGIPAEH